MILYSMLKLRCKRRKDIFISKYYFNTFHFSVFNKKKEKKYDHLNKTIYRFYTWVHPRFFAGFVLLNLYFLRDSCCSIFIFCVVFCRSLSVFFKTLPYIKLYGFWLPLFSISSKLSHTAWVRARLCKLQKTVHSARRCKW